MVSPGRLDLVLGTLEVTGVLLPRLSGWVWSWIFGILVVILTLLEGEARARAGTLSLRVKEATRGVAAVGALPLGFKVKLGPVRGKYLPVGLHAAEASYISASSLSAFRAAVLRAVWSSKMPPANTPVVLLALTVPFYIIRGWFRMMRRYLAHWPDEAHTIFRMLDLIAHGAGGHGLVHLLLISANELGFAWDGEEKGWIRAALHPLRMLSGPIQSAIFEAWHFNVSSRLAEWKGFRRAQFWIIKWSLQLLNSSHLRERDKCC